jgi:HEAT repeat protein
MMRNNAEARALLGLAMIAMGLTCASPRSFKSGLVHAAAQSLPSQSVVPRVENAKLETRAVSTSLGAALREITQRADKVQWVGYAVDQIPGERSMCCWNSGDSNGDGNCGTCRLESDRQNIGTTSKSSGTVKLEGSRTMMVLLRLEAQQVMKVRAFSSECVLDAGGLAFVWLTGVKPAESVELLSGYVRGADFAEHEDGSLAHGALMAMAMHGDAAADRAMESFVAPDQRESLRKQAAFWLGAARGKSGVSLLEKMAKSDPSPEVRSQVAFALHVSKEPSALDDIIRMAHEDPSAHVRGQALFWLAQKAGQKAAATIQGAIDNDPDTEVKKKAVFALSQLPKDEGVPKLIEVAQTNHNPAVRKQAMFWLGQSHDPRALDFFEKILSR